MTRLVWDLPLRVFHWVLAASVLACWGTARLGFGWMQWHMRLGECVMGLLIFRILWGLTGPKHARFSSFLKGPAAVLRYARGLSGSGDAVRSVGHNPLGGLMVILMLFLIAVQVGTGLFATDDITWSGPYNAVVSTAASNRLTSLHQLNFDFIWVAMGLHVAAVLYYALVKKQNLALAMLTGRKPAEAVPHEQAITSSELWKAAILIAASWAAVYWVLRAAPAESANLF